MSSTTYTRMMVELREMGFVREGRKFSSGPHRIRYQHYYHDFHEIDIFLARESDGNARVRLNEALPVVLRSELEWEAFRDLKMDAAKLGSAQNPVTIMDN